jgi:hypothetical protein
MTFGAAMILAVIVLGLHFQKSQNPAERLAFKAKRVELVERIRLAVASASEAEKSAVMAVTDEDSRTYADQARAAAATAEQCRRELEDLLATDAPKNEKDDLTQFSQAFAEFQRIDKGLLDLAVKNSNLKAYSLAFGPAAAALTEMDTALARVAAEHGNPASEAGLRTTQLADGARISALRILALLPPHIAEESDPKMDEMEAVMTKEDRVVRRDLENLAVLPNLAGNPDLAAAAARYARFSELRAQIIKLSRENTNVRSLAISLGQKRRAMLVCQDALAGLEQAIQEEPVPGSSNRAPVSPR